MKLLITSVVLLGCLGVSRAEESLNEKTQVAANSVARSGKKVLHRTKEAICGKLTGDNKVQCLAKKAGNRIEEGVDAVKDKAAEVKNAVSEDKK